jgi:CubicO group peptidase (beta-lactamase class C family)
MAHYRRVFCFLAAICWPGLAFGQDLTAVTQPEQLGFSAQQLQRLTDVYKGYVDRGELPGAVLLIARGDKIVYAEAIGFQDREKKLPMKKDAIFRLASMTKPVVSVAVMMLVEEGKLDLLTPVSRYLPEFKDLKVGVEYTDLTTNKKALRLDAPRRAMTIQDLLRHTSGLVYANNGDGLVHQAYKQADVTNRGHTLAEMVTKLSHQPLANHPGQVWEYSVSTDVLGRIVEIVSGMPLDAFIAQRIAKPLGMMSTDFYVHPGELGRLAQAQRPADPDARMPPDVTHKPALLSGGGGLAATAMDYLRFAQMLLDRGEYRGARLLAPHTVSLMTSNALPSGVGFADHIGRMGDIAPTATMGQGFGLGFAVRTAEGHNPLPGSVGSFYWTGAWGTTFWVDPREKLVAIQMIQTPANTGGPYRRAFRALTYGALTGTESER